MSKTFKDCIRTYFFLSFCLTLFSGLKAQEAYFIDGFHGGVWGHYPEGYTEFMLSLLDDHPQWHLNLEIEPDTWDRAKRLDPHSYKRISEMLNDQSVESRVEYVNPTYGQSYFFNISGESVIRQFSYGIKKLRNHFPDIHFHTYSSEEPCFTSALPQILQSFGIGQTSLKNPNTCWGGYTRAHGGELVNWIGPDGTGIVTVPRYEVENLMPGSTWETIGNANDPEYINAAFDYGIENPIGMTLQDAEWRWGPWLKGDYYKPSVYTTWRKYFEEYVNHDKITDWKFNQEDILVSLVWGGQILQRIAQQVRVSENNIVQAEKIAMLHHLQDGTKFPSAQLDDAWENLLLAQHHDCWIVPYNTSEGTSWAEKVVTWTGVTDEVSEAVIYDQESESGTYLKVYNTLGNARSEFVEVELPTGFNSSKTRVVDAAGNSLPSQLATDRSGKLLFKADVPAYGYKVFELKETQNASDGLASVKTTTAGDFLVETDLYKMVIDGGDGSIGSLIAKKLDNKEYVDQKADAQFNMLKGHFYDNGGFRTNTEQTASVEILENGSYRVELAIHTSLVDNPVTQRITLTAGEARIDFQLSIDWQENIGVGEYGTPNDTRDLRKAFYDDRYKLLSYFPLNLTNQRVFKNAPFDVLESGLENTFYGSWDKIKNNMIVDWVDITDGNEEYGVALFTDHTSTYAHGEDFPLALNVQYSGDGLWGQDYSVQGMTAINYSLVPHKGNWKTAKIWQKNDQYREPLRVVKLAEKPAQDVKSWLSVAKEGWTLSSVYEEDGDIYVRIFNAEGDAGEGALDFQFDPKEVALVELNGEQKRSLQIENNGENYRVRLAMPQFGIRTLRISGQTNL